MVEFQKPSRSNYLSLSIKAEEEGEREEEQAKEGWWRGTEGGEMSEEREME